MSTHVLGVAWRDTFVSVVVLVVILALSAFITNWFARAMYKRCAQCGALNARRRERCRVCETPFA